LKETIAATRAHDLARDLLVRTARWPKRLRYGLTGRVEGAAVDLVSALARAEACRGPARLRCLAEADLALASLRSLLRLGTDLGILSAGAEAHLAGRLEETGRLLGGWVRTERRRARCAPTP
jgi:hypothetical protein